MMEIWELCLVWRRINKRRVGKGEWKQIVDKGKRRGRRHERGNIMREGDENEIGEIGEKKDKCKRGEKEG